MRYLEEIHALFSEYSQLTSKLSKCRHDIDTLHKLRALHQRLMFLKETLHQHSLTESQKQQTFLKHHFAAIRLVNEHMNQLKFEIEFAFISAELEVIEREMTQLLEEIEGMKKEHNIGYESSLLPTPRPLDNHHPDSDD